MTPYYDDGTCVIYHGDCREIDAWLSADVLVTDPPYGIAWSRPFIKNSHHKSAHDGISNDHDTCARDDALCLWGNRPGVVFGSLRAPYPTDWKQMLVFAKPLVGCGLFGRRGPWLANWEPVFITGSWPDQTPTHSAVISTNEVAASGYSGYTTRAGHAHAKPVDVMQRILLARPPGVVADPFMGSGTTLRAAKNLGRKAIGIEIEERYCEIAAKRLAQGVLPL